MVDYLDLLSVVIVPVGHIIDVQLVVLEVEPGVWPPSSDLEQSIRLKKYLSPYTSSDTLYDLNNGNNIF